MLINNKKGALTWGKIIGALVAIALLGVMIAFLTGDSFRNLVRTLPDMISFENGFSLSRERDIDPGSQGFFEDRSDAIKIFEEIKNSFKTIMESEQEACFGHFPPVPERFFRSGYSIEIENDMRGMIIRLFQMRENEKFLVQEEDLRDPGNVNIACVVYGNQNIINFYNDVLIGDFEIENNYWYRADEILLEEYEKISFIRGNSDKQTTDLHPGSRAENYYLFKQAGSTCFIPGTSVGGIFRTSRRCISPDYRDDTLLSFCLDDTQRNSLAVRLHNNPEAYCEGFQPVSLSSEEIQSLPDDSIRRINVDFGRSLDYRYNENRGYWQYRNRIGWNNVADIEDHFFGLLTPIDEHKQLADELTRMNEEEGIAYFERLAQSGEADVTFH